MLGGLSLAQLRSELRAAPWQLEPSTTWYATASLRLKRYAHLHDRERHGVHARLASHVVAWLASQEAEAGLQLILATHPERRRVHLGLRVEVADEASGPARDRVLELGRDLHRILGAGEALAFEADGPCCSGLVWLSSPGGVGLAAVPVPRFVPLSGKEGIALLPQPQPDLWGQGEELLRLMLEQPAPVVLLLSLRRLRDDKLLSELESQLALVHARASSDVHGALFTSRGTTTRQFPENLLHIGRATKAIEKQAGWLDELRRGALAMQVHLLGSDRRDDALALAAQRALLGCDLTWGELSSEQCDRVRSGPLSALACPLGLFREEGADVDAAGHGDLVRAVPAAVAARALCLPPPPRGGQPGIPLAHAPVRLAPPSLSHHQGVQLGATRTHRASVPARLRLEDLNRHLYVVGKTGTGKTTLLTTLMFDLRALGEPFAVLDPHGDLSHDLPARIGGDLDVVVFDPARGVGPGLNPLANDGTHQGVERVMENVTRSMFQLYPPEFMGPVFERHSRALLLPLAVAGEGLESVSRMAHDKPFRRRILSKPQESEPLHAEVLSFWADELDRLSSSTLSEFNTYVLSKYDALVRSSSLRAATSASRPSSTWATSWTRERCSSPGCPKASWVPSAPGSWA